MPDVVVVSGFGSPGVPSAQVQEHDPKGQTQLGAVVVHAPSESPWAK
ncbi:MAG: hypothetical protein Q9M17_10300 [Mariprofundus sp.]|nr:hypothetical protein [Mariprofundus sp.]